MITLTIVVLNYKLDFANFKETANWVDVFMIIVNQVIQFWSMCVEVYVLLVRQLLILEIELTLV